MQNSHGFKETFGYSHLLIAFYLILLIILIFFGRAQKVSLVPQEEMARMYVLLFGITIVLGYNYHSKFYQQSSSDLVNVNPFSQDSLIPFFTFLCLLIPLSKNLIIMCIGIVICREQLAIKERLGLMGLQVHQ